MMRIRASIAGAALAVVACSLGCHRNGGTVVDAEAGEGAEAGGEAEGAEGDPGEGGDGPSANPGYPGELVSTVDMPADFLSRQKLKGRFEDQKFAFEAVMQLRGGTLTVLGLTPFGTKAFVLKQTGVEVEFEALIDREFPFPPEYMLQDIHRVWMWHARLPWGEEAPSEESPSVEVAGERVTEQWSGGALVRRTFARLDGEPAGEIRIDYVGGHRSGRPPKQVVLDNGWFGYQLEIETLDWRPLSSPP